MKSTFLFASLSMLAACGGSGTSSPTANFSTLTVTGSGEGLARGVTSDGRQALVFSSNIVELVAAANSSASNNLSVSASDFPIVSTNGNVVLRQGTGTAGGFTFNVRAMEDTRVSNAGVVFIEDAAGSADTTIVSGAAYSNAPQSGAYTYNGTQTSTPRSNIAPNAIGTFTMTADFGAQTFSYSGSSGNLSVSSTGSLDTANGRFAANNASINDAGTAYTGTMHGLLHGSAATSTSGIFYTNSSYPQYTGAFIGSR